MSFDLTILGSSSALPTSKRFPTAHLLKVDERFFLIDCGEGTQVQLRKFGHNPARIHHIFISHLHGDHVFGLFGLLSTLGMMGRKVPINLYGPATLEPMMKQHFSFFGKLPFEICYHIPGHAGDDCIFEDDRITVRSISLKHRTLTYGYLFREKKKDLNVRKECIEEYSLGIADVVGLKQGKDHLTRTGEVIPNQRLTLPPFRQRSYAYISDTVFDRTLSEKVKDVDLLFHEATFSGKDEKLARETLHSTSVQAATIAKEAGAGRLLIGHFSSRYKDYKVLVEEARAVFERTDGVTDGDLYSVEQRRVTTE
ncbi:MAG: ribonuclease Z [Bacteroidetes bacterium]|nr:ribonuclease Z [Bacteroidota bacterium]